MICFFLFFSLIFSQNQLADGVLAVVGDRVVLASDVLEETSLLAQQKNISPQKNPYLYDRLFSSVLNRQVDKNVVLYYALQDSSLEVSYDDINKTLDERLSFYVAQFGSEEEFEKQTNSSVSDMKKRHWDNIKNEMLVEKFKMGLVYDAFVTKNEVFSFYEEFKDSLPSSPEVATFSVLEKKTQPSQKSLSFFYNKANGLRDSLILGLLDFSEQALKRSEDPSVGVNKGFMETVRGDLVPEYEKAAYGLSVGEISKLVKTKFGYHLIKLISRVGEKIKTQHILFVLPAREEDFARSVGFLDSIKNVFKNDPGSFDSLSVALFEKGSSSGFYEDQELIKTDPLFLPFLKNGDSFSFSQVLKKEGSMFLLYKYSYTPPKKTNPKDDWATVESFALLKKREDLFAMWIKEKKENLYLKINQLY